MPLNQKLAVVMLNLNLSRLIDDAKCYATVRQLRWQGGVCCPNVAVLKSSSVARMTLKYTANATSVKPVTLTLTTSLARSLRVIINRCESGFCVCIGWV